MTLEPFTMRHKKALLEKRIKVSLPPGLRERIWQTIEAYDESYDAGEMYSSWTSHLEQTERNLKRLLGQTRLFARTPDGVKSGITAYFKDGYPSNALEVVEQFYKELSERMQGPFEKSINDSMLAFSCPWLLSNGVFFCLDSEFFAELLEGLRDRFRQHGFEGAQDELREAQEALSDGRHKDAIQAALKSFESTLKTIVNSESGTASELLTKFLGDGYLDDIPDDRAKAISTAVLKPLAVLRNNLAGHGQGNVVVNVPKSYATLALHLAAALNHFLVEQRMAKSPASSLEVPAGGDLEEIGDEDIPF